jgi:hypothetical protein
MPSWNAGPSKTAITGFVERVTQQGGADFVPAPARIAVFDNDGTLWAEQPIYFQLAFAIDRVKQLAPAVGGANLRHSTRAGGRQPREGRVRRS